MATNITSSTTLEILTVKGKITDVENETTSIKQQRSEIQSKIATYCLKKHVTDDELFLSNDLFYKRLDGQLLALNNQILALNNQLLALNNQLLELQKKENILLQTTLVPAAVTNTLYNLTDRLKSFAKATLNQRCIESSIFSPYIHEQIKNIFVRQCYVDVFDLLLEELTKDQMSYAISGSPGVGKSLFFMYILNRLIQDFPSKSLSLKPKRIVYHTATSYYCYDLEKNTVYLLGDIEVKRLVMESITETLYVIDGRDSIPFPAMCIVLFISSPRSKHYKEFVKQKKAIQWFFPTWTEQELLDCREKCYNNLSLDYLKEQYRIYGGVARYVLSTVVGNI
jgi:hypothetical protein